MKHSDDCSDLTDGMPSGSMPVSGPVEALKPVLASSAGPVSPGEPLPPIEPLPPGGSVLSGGSLLSGGSVLSGESVLSVLCGARDAVAGASQVPLADASSETLTHVVAAAARLRSVTQALLLGATAALEAKRAGLGKSALRDVARLSARNAKRTADTSEQIAQMPNVARGLAVGDLTPEHAEVLADAARQTSPEAVNTAAELLEAAAEVAPEVLRHDARDLVARHDPDGTRSVLDRQRRDRSAALFADNSTGMGVLNARFDPISYALVLQAVENYNDALWRLDGGRDGTPAQIRDNRQRLADSIFEMLTDRNALATVDHPVARAAVTARRPQHDSGDGCRHSPSGDADPDRNNGAGPESPAGRSIERWRAAQAPNQLVIIADIGVIDGSKLDGLCEMLGTGPIPPQILDNLSPDTRISGALFAGPGQVLWLGRSRRHASIAQQLAIAIRDRGCVLCRAPMHRCRYHHIDEWVADNGTTDTPNLAALCQDCHDDLHNNNRRLHHSTNGRWTTQPRTDADTTGTAGDRGDTTRRRTAKPSDPDAVPP